MRSLRSSSAPSTSSDLPQRLHTIPQAICLDVAVLELTDANFQAEVLEAPGSVLVDVWATWCGPCRLMAPLMDWAAAEYGERLKVCKLEADPNPVSRDAH